MLSNSPAVKAGGNGPRLCSASQFASNVPFEGHLS
jgi:hypothetical protein